MREPDSVTEKGRPLIYPSTSVLGGLELLPSRSFRVETRKLTFVIRVFLE
jgi:hypothetical protein